MKKILFRFDSGEGYGNGHLMRCLALAEVFNESEIYLVTNKAKGYYFSKWKKLLKEFHLVENQESNYNFIKNLCEKLRIDYLVLDGYHLKKVFVYKRFNVKKVIYIDDEGFYSDKIDIIINQTFFKKKINSKTKFLYGHKFFLCNSSLQKIKRVPKKSLLLSIGTSNDDIFLDKILTIFKNEKIKSRIYLTNNFNYRRYRDLDLNYISGDKLKKVYSEVSFAITAPGLMSLEMAFLNIPMIIYQTSIEQNNNIKFLVDNNFAYIIKNPKDLIQIINNIKFLKPKVNLDSDGAYRIKKEILK